MRAGDSSSSQRAAACETVGEALVSSHQPDNSLYGHCSLSLERACRSKCQKYEKFERESSPRKGFDSVPNLLKISKNCIDGPWPFAGEQTSGLQTIDIIYKSIEIRARPRESRQTDVLRGIPGYQSRSQHLSRSKYIKAGPSISRSKSRRKW